MAKSKFQIAAVIGVEAANFVRGLNKASSKLTGWAKQTMKTVMSVAMKGTSAAAAAIAAFGAASLKEFATFEKGMLEVFTLLPGISKQAMSKMEDDVLSLSLKMGVLPEEVVPALYQALSAGVPSNNVFGFLENAAKSAKGGVATLTESVAVLTSVTNAYGPENLSAADAADILFTTVKSGVTNFGELASSLYNVVPSASAAGVSFDQVGAAIAALTKAGTPTAVATTQIRQAILAMMAPNNAMVKGFEKSGMSVGKLAEIMKQPGGLLTAMQMVEQAAGGDMTALKKMMGSVQGLQALLTITANSGQGFVQLLDDFAARAGANQAAFQQMDQGISRSWEKIVTSMKVAMIKAGKAIAPFAQAAVPTILRIIQMIESIPWTKMMQGFANVWLRGIRPHLQNLAAALLSLPWGNLLMTLRPVAELVIKAIQNIIKIAIALTPAIVPGISVLGALFVFIYGKFFFLVNLLSKLAPSLGLIFTDMFEIMRTAFLYFMNPTKENFQAFMTFTKKKLKELWRHIKMFGVDLEKIGWEMWLKFKLSMLATFEEMFNDAKKKFSAFLSGIPGYNKLAAAFGEAWVMVKEELLKVWEALKEAFGSMGEGMAEGAQDTAELKQAFKDTITAVTDFVVAIIKMVAWAVKAFMMIGKLYAQLFGLTSITDKTKNSTSFLVDALTTLVYIFKGFIQIVTMVVDGFMKIFQWIVSCKQQFEEMGMAFELVWDIVSNVVNQIRGKIMEFYNFMKKHIGEVAELFVEAWDAIANSTGTMWERIKKVFNALKALVFKILFGGTVTKDFKKAFDYISKVVMKVLDKIQSVFKTVFDGVKIGLDGLQKVFKTFGDFVNGIFDKILKVGGKAMDLAKGVLKAAGGVFGGIMDKLGGGGGGGKSAPRPRVGGGASGLDSATITTSLKPIVERLTSMDGSLKSIDATLKGKFVNQ